MTAVEAPEPAGPLGLAGHVGAPAPAAVTAPVTAAALSVPPPRWRPWHGRPRTRDLICLGGIALSVLYGLAMIPLTPGLIATRPVLLELLSGSTSSVVAAGAFADVESKLQLTAVVAAALPGMMKFDLLFWWAGVLWGHRIVEKLARQNKQAAAFARRAEQRGSIFAGAAVLLSAFLPVPTPLVYAAAGWAGLRLLPFAGCDLIGSAAWAAFLAALGYLLGTSGVAAANLVSRYALVTMIVLAAIAIAPHAWHVLRARRARSRALRAPSSA
jgi:membrane-associated protein